LPGCIADDFTGATGLAGTIALTGLSAVQVNGVPEADLAIDPADAVVVALKSRTVQASVGEALLSDTGVRTHPPAADAVEELVATARLYLLLRHERVRPLSEERVAELRRRYPS
jgi:hypothetical protein